MELKKNSNKELIGHALIKKIETQLKPELDYVLDFR